MLGGFTGHGTLDLAGSVAGEARLRAHDLKGLSGYVPQPDEQLAGMYRRADDDRTVQSTQMAKFRQHNREIG